MIYLPAHVLKSRADLALDCVMNEARQRDGVNSPEGKGVTLVGSLHPTFALKSLLTSLFTRLHAYIVTNTLTRVNKHNRQDNV